MKIKEILEKMNEEIKCLNGVKVNDFEDFHNEVRKLIKPYLSEDVFLITSWRVYLNSDLMLYNEVFVQTIDFQDDKRVKYGRKGMVISTKFEIGKDYKGIIEDMTIGELCVYAKKEKILKNIEGSKQCINIKLQEIERLKADIKEEEEKLQYILDGE